MTDREMKELELRRAQMARQPFCPDHRDKVHGLACRECEIEHLRRDAERYRWLRGNGLTHINFEGLTHDTSDVGLDYAIDTAMNGANG